MRLRAAYGLLAVLWLALVLPHIGARYSYDWDSSQFERGIEHFDIARHQPHPPGYPLWILTLRGLAPLVGGGIAAQVVLAMVFTIAALIFFRALATGLLGEMAGLAATAALAFSPLVLLHAMTPLLYAVDLFASCAIGWFAARFWEGDTRWETLAFALAAVTAGFRPSGVTFLLPLLLVARWRAGADWRLLRDIGIYLVCGLAWYVPTALLSGGFAALSKLNRDEMIASFRTTSIIFGAPGYIHAHMAIDVCIFFALALVGLALPVAICIQRKRAAIGATPLCFALWLAPNLAVVYLMHCGQPGYILLSVPPLVLLAASYALPALRDLRWTAAIIAVSLGAGYFPYERFINPAVPTAVYQVLRSSPRMPGLLEDSQRRIRCLIDALPGPPDQKLIVCFRQRSEAPNIRTVTEEYPDVYWAEYSAQGLRVYAPHGGEVSNHWPREVSAVAWLCNGAGPPPAFHGRRVDGNRLFSLWLPD